LYENYTRNDDNFLVISGEGRSQRCQDAHGNGGAARATRCAILMQQVKGLPNIVKKHKRTQGMKQPTVATSLAATRFSSEGA
jgi:hypothetical protein